MPNYFKPDWFPKIVLLLFLLTLLGVGAVPSYLTGKWPWVNPPPVVNLKQLKQLRQTGLDLPNWQSYLYKNVPIGGHKWLVQELKQSNLSAVVLLLPQNGPKDQPQVEWTDLSGFHRWQTDASRPASFTVKLTDDPQLRTAIVEAEFFRAKRNQQTYAVLQWYAWPDGGSPVPSHWFWRDRLAQLSRRRVPWVAVGIILPAAPFGDIESVWPQAKVLAESVQTALMRQAF